MACSLFRSLSMSLLPGKSFVANALQLKLFEVAHIQRKPYLIIRASFTPATRSELLLLVTSEETKIRFDWFPDRFASCCRHVSLSILVKIVPLMASSCRIAVFVGIGILESSHERFWATKCEPWSQAPYRRISDCGQCCLGCICIPVTSSKKSGRNNRPKVSV